MVEKVIIPYSDHRASTDGVSFDRGRILDTLPSGQGAVYAFDLSEIFTSPIQYAAIRTQNAKPRALTDSTFRVVLEPGSWSDRDRGPVVDDYGQGQHERGRNRYDRRIDVVAISTAGEWYETAILIAATDARQANRPGPGNITTIDGFAADSDGVLRFAETILAQATVIDQQAVLLVGDGSGEQEGLTLDMGNGEILDLGPIPTKTLEYEVLRD